MSFQSNRREFLKGSTALLAAGTMLDPFALAKADDDPIPIIDTHQHLWQIGKYQLPWLKNSPELNRSYLIDDYNFAVEGIDILKAVYMEVDVDPSQQVAEAESILAVCESGKTKTVAAVISGRPDSKDFPTYLDRFKGIAALKGVRQVLHVPETPGGYCLRTDFVRGIKQLGKRNLTFDLCMRNADLKDVPKLVDLAGGTRYVLDHCGNPDVLAKNQSAWKTDIDAIAAKDQVVCKVSGILASTKGKPWTPQDLAPVVNHVLDAFGPDRVMFGGDWPVCTLGGTYKQWVEALRTIVQNRPLEDRRKLFFENAMKYYDLG